MAENTNTEQWALEELGFYLDERDGVWVVFDDGEEATPANLTERVLWDALKKARASLSLPAAGQEPGAWMDDRGLVVSAEWLASDEASSDYRAAYNIPLYAAPQPAVAAGWVMVPVEPTLEMMTDATRAYQEAEQSLGKHNAPWAAYRAMLAALPPAPSAEGESNG